MGKRKRSEGSVVCGERGDEEKEVEGRGNRFFACYLLTSLCPRFKGHTYIGFTVNPGRRIRQHNGEVRMGAWRTKKKRPWEMVLCIYGFPTNVAALQFEWAWQHPVESRAVRQAAASFKSLGGVANKIKLAYTMLTLPQWQNLNLTVNFFSTKYKIHSAGCPSLPEHMRVEVSAMDELPCYTGIDWNECRNDDCDNSEECDGSSESLRHEGSVELTSSNSSSSNQQCTEENIDEHIDWREEFTEGHTEENSTPHRDDPRQSYILIDSPVKSSSSTGSDSYNLTDNFRDRYELHEEFGGILCQPANKQCSTEVDPFPGESAGFSCEVEVIDVVTPPCYKAGADSKKRRVSTACPDIIDLTESPIFV